ncbi:DUF418 domain-containing protein [Naasia lichenicola]|uniref:DUF418 domain-containing protein n=1 Tax=Naasia lichenicola TaxID=2565933 RepID=A0A4S4FRB6_9MICO|nr:DUF418 domain-containing protein [Naasia lichenicola]THG33170.1 DUF418 domain-containing protein [Naasia lichenicola]
MADARPHPPGIRTAGDGGRIVGVDVARGLAVMGMFVAHLVPSDWPETISDGRSSVLFATLAGVSLGLISGGSAPTERPSRASVRVSVLLRALFLIALGLLLRTFDSGIAIILDSYGAFYVVLVPLLFLRRSGLATVAFALAALATAVLPGVPSSTTEAVGGDPLLFLPSDWFYSGYYPGVLWIVYLLVGLIAACSDLTRRSTQLLMIGGGAVASTIGYGGAALLGTDASAHSDTVWEMFGAGGLAVLVIGGLTLSTTAPRIGPVARAIGWPIGAVGAMPLTIYTVQIAILAVFRQVWADGGEDGERLALLIALIAGAIAFATLWRRFAGRGPLERLVSAVTTVSRR